MTLQQQQQQQPAGASQPQSVVPAMFPQMVSASGTTDTHSGYVCLSSQHNLCGSNLRGTELKKWDILSVDTVVLSELISSDREVVQVRDVRFFC